MLYSGVYAVGAAMLAVYQGEENIMTLTRSKKTALKIAATAGFASLAFGLIAPAGAEAANPTPAPKEAFALTINDAVMDFGRNDDRVTIKCSLSGVVGTNPDGTNATPADFRIEVTIVDLRPGGASHSQVSPPTVVR